MKPHVQTIVAKYLEKKVLTNQAGEERIQYQYGPRQIANRHKEKAERLHNLSKHIKDLEAQLRQDLKAAETDKRMTALAVALINHTYERVGNPTSAEDGHFGVTGWLKKHLSFDNGQATLSYVGKSGVRQTKKVTDKALVSALKEAAKGKSADEAIFDCPDCKVTSKEVNAYLKPFDVTAKDLRGFHANREMKEKLAEIRKDGPGLPFARKDKDKILKQEFQKALDAVAAIVGHEASTLRNQYLVPHMEEQYMKDGTVPEKMVKEGSLYLEATKSDSEKEEQYVEERFVRPEPKVKPPRKDLRKLKLEDSDPETEMPSASNDKDLSLNYKVGDFDDYLRLAKQAPMEATKSNRPALPKTTPAGEGTKPAMPAQPKEQPKRPGEVWQTDSGTWAGKNQQSQVDYFKQKEDAEAFAKGTTTQSDKENSEAKKPAEGERGVAQTDPNKKPVLDRPQDRKPGEVFRSSWGGWAVQDEDGTPKYITTEHAAQEYAAGVLAKQPKEDLPELPEDPQERTQEQPAVPEDSETPELKEDPQDRTQEHPVLSDVDEKSPTPEKKPVDKAQQEPAKEPVKPTEKTPEKPAEGTETPFDHKDAAKSIRDLSRGLERLVNLDEADLPALSKQIDAMAPLFQRPEMASHMEELRNLLQGAQDSNADYRGMDAQVAELDARLKDPALTKEDKAKLMDQAVDLSTKVTEMGNQFAEVIEKASQGLRQIARRVEKQEAPAKKETSPEGPIKEKTTQSAEPQDKAEGSSAQDAAKYAEMLTSYSKALSSGSGAPVASALSDLRNFVAKTPALAHYAKQFDAHEADLAKARKEMGQAALWQSKATTNKDKEEAVRKMDAAVSQFNNVIDQHTNLAQQILDDVTKSTKKPESAPAKADEPAKPEAPSPSEAPKPAAPSTSDSAPEAPPSVSRDTLTASLPKKYRDRLGDIPDSLVDSAQEAYRTMEKFKPSYKQIQKILSQIEESVGWDANQKSTVLAANAYMNKHLLKPASVSGSTAKESFTKLAGYGADQIRSILDKVPQSDLDETARKHLVSAGLVHLIAQGQAVGDLAEKLDFDASPRLASLLKHVPKDHLEEMSGVFVEPTYTSETRAPIHQALHRMTSSALQEYTRDVDSNLTQSWSNYTEALASGAIAPENAALAKSILVDLTMIADSFGADAIQKVSGKQKGPKKTDTSNLPSGEDSLESQMRRATESDKGCLSAQKAFERACKTGDAEGIKEAGNAWKLAQAAAYLKHTAQLRKERGVDTPMTDAERLMKLAVEKKDVSFLLGAVKKEPVPDAEKASAAKHPAGAIWKGTGGLWYGKNKGNETESFTTQESAENFAKR